MRLTRVSAPAGLPVEVDAARDFARVNSLDEDAQIDGLIQAAVDLLDGPAGLLGRAIVTQSWLMELPQWPGSMVIPVEPVQALAITYLDAGGQERAVDAGLFYLSAKPAHAHVLHWAQTWSEPALSSVDPYPVKILITAGYGGASAAPPALKTAILMMVKHWYDHRDQIGDLPLTAQAMIARFRRVIG